MKQFKIFLVTLVALALAMPALAAVNVKMKGDFQNFFQYSNNAQVYDSGDGTSQRDTDDSDFRYNSRVRLTWIAEDDEKKVRGTLGTEFDITAGNGRGDRTRNGPGGDFEGDNTNFELRWAFIDFELPFDAASRVYMGLMPVEMNPWIFCDNAMGVRVARSFGDWDAAIGWYRNDADNNGVGGSQKSEYADLATLDIAWNINEGNKIAAFAYYMDDGDNYNGLQSNNTVGNVTDSFGDTERVKVYWLGLSGEMEVGNFFGNATGAYQGGTADLSEVGLGDADIKAWMAQAELGINIDKAYVKVGGLYMSGDDKADDEVENFFGIDTDNTMIGSVALFEFWDATGDYAFYGPQIGRFGAMHLYAHAGYEFNDKTDARIGFLWLNSAEDIPYLDGSGDSDKNIGYEINGEVTYKITKNLTAGLAAGYLIGDDGWDALATNGEGDDLWKVISMFRYKF